jgi:uncharacterized protein (TIGR02246 family)
MKRNLLLIVAAGLAVASPSTRLISAQDSPPAAAEKPRREADEAAIREISSAFARAFEKGDARAVSAFWTEEGEYLEDGGEPVRGREALEKAYAGLFAKRPELKVESKTESIRFLGTDTAVEEGTFTVRAKGAPPDASRFSTLYARQGGRWLIALLKEWGDDAANRPTLKDLAWLVGTWEGEGKDAKARVTYEWSPTRAFLLARFSIEGKKGDTPASAGLQVIGLDPAEGVIRAWTFAPDGGFGGATWARDGRGWAIDSEGTQADGSRTTALNHLVPDGDDAFTWRSVRRTVAGSDEPDLAPVKVRRVRENK